MPTFDIPTQRLYNQHLLGLKFETPAEVVAYFGAVQAQDYAGAKWAVAQRTTDLTDADLDRALADGSILRTHVLRPTWHFVTPADIRWMLALTAPRVKAAGASRWRQLGLDEALVKRSNAALIKALPGGKQLTRLELAAAIDRAGIATNGERSGHILMRAELDGLICSGGRRGKQFTYALLDERAPNARTLPRDEALAQLALRYFTGHGPATVQDLAWWSGLTLTDARRGLESIKDQLRREVLDDQDYWLAASDKHAKAAAPTALLLPAFDEYTVGYADRSAVFDAAHTDQLDVRNSGLALAPVVLIRGRIVGNWKRTLQKDAVVMELKPFRPLTKIEQRAITQAAEHYGAFLGLSVVWE
ncbi:MAG: AlkZ family DNA glycosylase [Chloroflexi bacterium]|nr:AlkZ family DNA glycosylase [Chloroflexota bacterium]